MSPKILYPCFFKLYIFLQLHWAALDNEEWVTGIVVTGKVVNSDLIAFAGLQMIGLFGLNGYRLDCIGYGLHLVAFFGLAGYRLGCIGCGLHLI